MRLAGRGGGGWQADVKGYLDLATALFAPAAAVFWFLSAYGELPPIVTYWGATPPSDPHQMADEASAWLNTVAATLSGFSAFSAFLSYWAEGSRTAPRRVG